VTGGHAVARPLLFMLWALVFSLVCAVIALGTWTAVAWLLVRGRSSVEREP
jgi:hypothetical protein